MLEILKKRRSARSFTHEKVDPAKLEILKESLLRSPSSKNNRPWEFVLVDDGALLETLSASKEHGSSFLKQAPLGIVILGDERKSDVWVEDCAIAAITVQYMAEDLQLGSCWIQIRKREQAGGNSAEAHVQKLLGIPSHYRVASIVAVGVRDGERSGVRFEDLDFGRFHMNRF